MNNWQTLVRKIGLLCSLIAFTYGAITAFPLFAGISAGIAHKETIAAAHTAPPKLFLVGGSNIAYGLDSDLIAEALDRPVINFGWAAGLGLRYLLEEAKPFIQSGDTVVLFLEYEHYHNNLLEGNQVLLRLLAHRPEAWQYLSDVDQVVEISAELPFVMQEKFHEILRKPLRETASERQTKWVSEFFTARGDFLSPFPQVPLQFFPIVEPDGYNPEAIEVLRIFYEEMTARGATVVYIPPSLAQSQYEFMENTAAIAHVEAELATIDPAWMLATATDYVFPDELFYDTTYHLNYVEGKRLRTEKVIADLQK